MARKKAIDFKEAGFNIFINFFTTKRDLLKLFFIFLSSNEAFMLTNRSTDVILLLF